MLIINKEVFDMALCVKCSNSFSNARAELGHRTCMDCGEAAAVDEAQRRKKCIAPAYNKGAYQYMGSASDARDAGKK